MAHYKPQRPSGSMLQPASTWLDVVGAGLQRPPFGSILQPALVKRSSMAPQVRLRKTGKAISTFFGTALFARGVAAEALQGAEKSAARTRPTVMRRIVRMGDSSKGRSTSAPMAVRAAPLWQRCTLPQ